MAQNGGAPVLAAPDLMLGMSRSMVVMMQFNEQKADYENSLAKLEAGTDEYLAALAACHERGAKRCADVTRLHRGLYVKAAQFIASLRGGTGERGVPRQYTEALKVFTDQAPHQPIAKMTEVLQDVAKLGKWPAEPLDASCTFRSFDELPIASASLAQVHSAVLQDGTHVAVKLQYPELRKEMASDFAVFKQMGAQIKQMAAGYDVMWIVEDFEKHLSRELDFELEADNAEETRRQLADLLPGVFVPRVLRAYCSKRVLMMEFCEGLLKINEPTALSAAGVDPEECAALVCSTFARMIFVHGRVHADPHAGNIYIRPIEVGGVKRPQLVLLDHGLYHDLNENDVRLFLCRYWRACCSKDAVTMAVIGKRFAGELRRFLPLVLSPWFIFGNSGISLHEVLSAVRGELPDTIGIRDVADFVVATREGGANLIGLLHSLGYTRGILEALSFPEFRRVSTMLSFALAGDAPASQVSSLPPRLLSRRETAWVWWQVTLLRCHIGVLAPLARPLIWYARAEQAPSLWVLASAPVVVAAAIYAALSAAASQQRTALRP